MGGRLINKEIAERFGRNLFHARHHAGFSQDELARLTSLHRTEISLIERGRRLPRVDTLIKLTSALAVGVDQLIWGLDAPGDRAHREDPCPLRNRPIDVAINSQTRRPSTEAVGARRALEAGSVESENARWRFDREAQTSATSISRSASSSSSLSSSTGPRSPDLPASIRT